MKHVPHGFMISCDLFISDRSFYITVIWVGEMWVSEDLIILVAFVEAGFIHKM